VPQNLHSSERWRRAGTYSDALTTTVNPGATVARMPMFCSHCCSSFSSSAAGAGAVPRPFQGPVRAADAAPPAERRLHDPAHPPQERAHPRAHAHVHPPPRGGGFTPPADVRIFQPGHHSSGVRAPTSHVEPKGGPEADAGVGGFGPPGVRRGGLASRGGEGGLSAARD
jgi:hypothetical protein